MTLTSLTLLSDEPEAIRNQLERIEARAITPAPPRTDWDALPREFYLLSLLEQWRRITHRH